MIMPKKRPQSMALARPRSSMVGAIPRGRPVGGSRSSCPPPSSMPGAIPRGRPFAPTEGMAHHFHLDRQDHPSRRSSFHGCESALGAASCIVGLPLAVNLARPGQPGPLGRSLTLTSTLTLVRTGDPLCSPWRGSLSLQCQRPGYAIPALF